MRARFFSCLGAGIPRGATASAEPNVRPDLSGISSGDLTILAVQAEGSRRKRGLPPNCPDVSHVSTGIGSGRLGVDGLRLRPGPTVYPYANVEDPGSGRDRCPRDRLPRYRVPQRRSRIRTPIVQPGAPGQETRVISVEKAVDLSRVGHARRCPVRCRR